MKYIPLKIKKSGYEKFYHQEAVERVGQLVCDAEENIFIPHPCFYRNDRVCDRGSYTFVSWFARYYGRKMFYQYGKVTFQNLEIIDCLDDEGYFARFSGRLGCKVRRCCSGCSRLERELNHLFYAKISYGEDSWDTEDTYKIAVSEEKDIEVIAPYIGRCNEILLKGCTTDRIIDICSTLNLRVTQKICEVFENLERKAVYMLVHKNQELDGG